MLAHVAGHAFIIEGSLQSKKTQLADSVQSIVGVGVGALVGSAGLFGNHERGLVGIIVGIPIR